MMGLLLIQKCGCAELVINTWCTEFKGHAMAVSFTDRGSLAGIPLIAE